MNDTNEKLPNGWPIPKGSHVIVFCTFTLLFWVYLITDSDGYAGILDNFNLIIHEAGHMIFMPFGRTMHFWGGTLLQCLVPLAFLFSFWNTKQPAGVAFSGIWLGQNLLNISRYISDARDMILPLLGGGIHDWNTILGSMGLVRHCKTIGGLVFLLGWGMMLASATWYCLRWWNYSTSEGDI